MNLSEHFSLEEFLITSHLDLKEEQQQEAKHYIPYLQCTTTYLLEPIRAYFKKPVIITSGFRCKTLNERVHGSVASQHCIGQAADFIINNITTDEILEEFVKGSITFHFGQVIKEIVKGKEWTHISLGYPFRRGKPNTQILFTRDGLKVETVERG